MYFDVSKFETLKYSLKIAGFLPVKRYFYDYIKNLYT